MYRAYVSERQRHEKLEFLYEANRALTRSPEVAEAIEGVLARSLEAFRSEIAEVVLFSADGTPLRTTYGPGEERVTMVEGDREAADELASLVDRSTPSSRSCRLTARRVSRHISSSAGSGMRWWRCSRARTG